MKGGAGMEYREGKLKEGLEQQGHYSPELSCPVILSPCTSIQHDPRAREEWCKLTPFQPSRAGDPQTQRCTSCYAQCPRRPKGHLAYTHTPGV